jgi:indole-3-glycerol phosphate synthase
VNARDLREPSHLDRGRIHGLAKLAPPGHVLVAESGITTVQDAESLPPRVDAILVGTALVRSSDPASLIRAMAAARPGKSLA